MAPKLQATKQAVAQQQAQAQAQAQQEVCPSTTTPPDVMFSVTPLPLAAPSSCRLYCIAFKWNRKLGYRGGQHRLHASHGNHKLPGGWSEELQGQTKSD